MMDTRVESGSHGQGGTAIGIFNGQVSNRSTVVLACNLLKYQLIMISLDQIIVLLFSSFFKHFFFSF